MQRAAYLDDRDVRDFRDWAAPLVAGKRSLPHHWHIPCRWDDRRWGPWSCETLFDAFRKYEWRFKVDVPGRGECRGRFYQETVDVLDALKRQLQDSDDRRDATRFLKAAVAVVHWGGAGVKQNEGKLRTLGDKALPLLTANAGCSIRTRLTCAVSPVSGR